MENENCKHSVPINHLLQVLHLLQNGSVSPYDDDKPVKHILGWNYFSNQFRKTKY